MKNYFKFLVVLAITISLLSCEENCGECFTPPDGISLMITDKNDGSDLIFNGTYKPDSIEIFYYDQQNIKHVNFDIYTDSIGHHSKIVSFDIAFKSVEGFKRFYLYLDYSDTDTIYYDEVTRSENCCTWHETLSFTINDQNVEYNSEKYSYIHKK